MTSFITTHVLDAVTGSPARGVGLSLSRVSGAGADTGTGGAGSSEVLATGETDADGRARELGPEQLEPGHYRLEFATGEWFAAQQRESFYPRVSIDFTVTAGQDHYHVPVLLSPFAYSTYRGS